MRPVFVAQEKPSWGASMLSVGSRFIATKQQTGLWLFLWLLISVNYSEVNHCDDVASKQLIS